MLNSLSHTDHERLSRLAAVAVCVLAAAVCLWFVLRLLWLVVPHAETNADTVPARSIADASTTPASSVAKWHLFGNPQSINYTRANAAAATTLKLTLFGTLALPDPRDARAIAIVADAQGSEHSYRIGADVGSGAKLVEVYADHVVLNHEGAAETLVLPRPEQHASPLPQGNRGNLAMTRSDTAASVPPGYVTSGTPAPAAAKTSDRIDPQEFARQIRPVFAGGKIIGADLSGADAAVLGRVGLKPTDVVTAVNGMPLTTVSDPQQLMDSLKNNASIQVTVQRDGKPATLTLNLR